MRTSFLGGRSVILGGKDVQIGRAQSRACWREDLTFAHRHHQTCQPTVEAVAGVSATRQLYVHLVAGRPVALTSTKHGATRARRRVDG